jgi:outer membrane protein
LNKRPTTKDRRIAACLLRIHIIGVLLVVSPAARSDHLPLWEMGIGLAGASLPAYRGSDKQENFLLPFPYFIYRGERLNIDRRGLRGLLYESKNVAVNLSAGLGIPVDSAQNNARQGMPDLDPTILFGPSLDFLVAGSDAKNYFLKIKFPVQATIATDLLRYKFEGWFFFPHVNFVARKKWAFGAALGPTFATQKYHDYYYGVDPQFATGERPAYNPDAGYSGLRLSLTLSRRIGNYWAGTFVRYENLNGSEFADSPLVKQDYSLIVGLAASWIFLKSEQTVSDRLIIQDSF